MDPETKTKIYDVKSKTKTYDVKQVTKEYVNKLSRENSNPKSVNTNLSLKLYICHYHC